MDYARQQRDPARHMVGIAFVIVIHVLVFIVLGFIEFPQVKVDDASGPQRPLS